MIPPRSVASPSVLTRLAGVVCGFLILGACGTETGNPEFLDFEYNATTSEPGRVRLGPSEGGVSVDTVWLRLADVTFVDCSGVPRGTLAGLGFADHGGDDAALQGIELADVAYCGLRTRLFEQPDPQVEPEAIAGASIALSGTLLDGRAFSITSHQTLDIELELASVAPPMEGGWLLAFDVAAWVDEETLGDTLANPVVIDADAQPEILTAFEDSVRSGIRLHHDLNGNGQVNDGEPVIGR